MPFKKKKKAMPLFPLQEDTWRENRVYRYRQPANPLSVAFPLNCSDLLFFLISSFLFLLLCLVLETQLQSIKALEPSVNQIHFVFYFHFTFQFVLCFLYSRYIYIYIYFGFQEAEVYNFFFRFKATVNFNGEELLDAEPLISTRFVYQVEAYFNFIFYVYLKISGLILLCFSVWLLSLSLWSAIFCIFSCCRWL